MTHLEYAIAYAALGWHILPCWWIKDDGKCACGNPDCKSPGKHPIHNLVKNGQDSATTDPAILTEWWTAYPMANMAVHLAMSGLCAIDVDPRNGGYETMERLEADHGSLFSDLLQYSGGGGEHRLFAKPKDNQSLPGKLGAGVDMKLNGYIMLEPSNHISGGLYSWEASSDPLDGAVASPLPDYLRDLAGYSKPAGLTGGITGYQPSDKAMLALPQMVRDDILEAIPHINCHGREEWLRVGMAFHATEDTQWGFYVWDNWSQTSSKYDPVDQVRVWNSFKSNKGVDHTITYNSLFAWAKAGGWRPAPKLVPSVANEELAALARDPVLERVEVPVLSIKPFPIESLNELARWFDTSADETHPLVSQVSVLSVVCTAAARRYVSPFGDPASMYFGILAPSISQARYAHAGADKVLFEAGMRSMLRTTRVSAPQQLFATLHRAPATLYLADDYGDQLRFAKRQPSGQLEQTLSILTGRAHSGQTMVLDNWAELGITKTPNGEGHQPVIYSPSLTMLALIGGAQMQNLFKAGEFARGAADAFVFLPALENEDWRQAPRRARSDVPASATALIRRLRGFALAGDTQMSAEQIFSGTAGVMPSPQVVEFTGAVQDIEASWVAAYARRGPQVRQLATGARRQFVRLCVAMGAWANPDKPIANFEIVQWCADFVRGCLDATILQADLRSSEDDEKPDIYQRVLEFIDGYGATGVEKRMLAPGCKAFRALAIEKRDSLVELMLTDGAVVYVPMGTGTKRKTLVCARYVKTAEPTLIAL